MRSRNKECYNNKIFAMLIEKARGERSLRLFAEQCGISYLQMRKLHACEQENPPGRKLMGKLAAASMGGITLEDYLFAAGAVCTSSQLESVMTSHEKTFLEKYRTLGSKQKRTLEDFLDFLETYRGE